MPWSGLEVAGSGVKTAGEAAVSKGDYLHAAALEIHCAEYGGYTGIARASEFQSAASICAR